MQYRAAALTTMALVAMAALGASLVATIRTPPHRASSQIAIPKGWTTVRFEDAAISVPGTWYVQHNHNACPIRRTTGTVDVGPITGFTSCAAGGPKNVVYFGSITGKVVKALRMHKGIPVVTPHRTLSTPLLSTRVNGFSAFYPSPETGLFGKNWWAIPALGVTVWGGGPTFVAVLKTLREAK